MNQQTESVRELTIRGLILGVLITTIFTAANVYLGLKVGLTFATSIPAAVISMAILSAFKGATILENNIVQTVASAAGTLSAIIFVLPGLVIVGAWTGFPFWTSFLICASGGVLGVLFTIPLRRAMVTTSDLPYPEGVAAAEVLEVGSRAREAMAGDAGGESREGLIAVVYGTIASAALAVANAMQLVPDSIPRYFRIGPTAISGYDMSFSLALLGAGYLVGLSVGMAMLFGLVIAWGAAVPILTGMQSVVSGDIDVRAHAVWFNDVRFIGAGTIGIAAIWTLLKLAGPVVSGIIGTATASRARKSGVADRRDTDMSISWILLLTLISLAVIVYILIDFLQATPLASQSVKLIIAAVPFIFFGGFIVAAICGYMAGLIGASNSPISGVGILAILSCAALLVAVAQTSTESRATLVALALFVTAVVFAIATISNNNLQDLKTGQLVGATPSAQQWALVVGVIAGAIVIAPVLNLLYHAFGFAGVAQPAGAVGAPLAAPQANLISTLAQGVIQHKLNLRMLEIGCVLGVVVVVIDELLGAAKLLRLPPLAIGIGIYLPMYATLPVVIGSVIGYFYDLHADRTKKPEHAKRLAVLVASGMIVGESLFGVVHAALVYFKIPIAVVADNYPPAIWIGVTSFVALTVLLYGWMLRRSRL